MLQKMLLQIQYLLYGALPWNICTEKNREVSDTQNKLQSLPFYVPPVEVKHSNYKCFTYINAYYTYTFTVIQG